MEKHILSVPEDISPERIDKYLSVILSNHAEQVYSRSAISSLVEQGFVLVNGKAVGKSSKLSGGEEVVIEFPELRPLEAVPQKIPLEIVFEDKHLLVVNKPQGMVVHPAAGNPDGTLVNALLYHCRGALSGINGVLRPGIVHRIDKDTSGLLIVAKTNEAHLGLAKQIKEHSFLREYQAVVIGHLKNAKGNINAPIGRDLKDRKKMAVTTVHAKPAITHYQVLDTFPGYSHVSFRLETGRTHQIRVHMSSIGHAIVGDPVYAPRNTETFGLSGQCLHAKKIGFVHPVSNEYLEFDSELPEHFITLLNRLKRM